MTLYRTTLKYVRGENLDNAELVVSIINNVGFPIVVAGALFWQNIKTNANHQELIRELAGIIDNNTDSIKELSKNLGENNVQLQRQSQ